MPLLQTEEPEKALMEWDQTVPEYPAKCVHELFEEQVERTPGAVALEYEEQQISYGELNRRANQLGHYLRQQAVGPEIRVGICLQRGPEMMVALLGILKSGGAYVPLDPEFPDARLTQMLADSLPAVVLTTESLRSRLPQGVDVLNLDRVETQVALQTCSVHNPSASLPFDVPAYVIYTSGSTGVPKGVVIPHRALSVFLHAMSAQVHFDSNHRHLAIATVSFDMSIPELFLPLCHGSRVIIASREDARDAARLCRLMRYSEVNSMQATPSHWSMVLQNDPACLPGIRVLCGGEALSRELARSLHRVADGGICNLYGPTEATVWASIYRLKDIDFTEQAAAVISIGSPLANYSMYVLDHGLEPHTGGIAGDLFIGGSGLARGYLNLPELTAERFVPNSFSRIRGARMYETGDRARRRWDQELDYLGRSDYQVKVRGHRIELGEIEAALLGHGTVEQAVVVVRGAGGQERLVAYVVGKAEETGWRGVELKDFLRERLPEYMVPSAFVVLAKLPQTTNGKVDRKALPEPDSSGEGELEHESPRNVEEEILCGFWMETLQHKSMDIRANFFKMGGNSLLATQVISRIRATFAVEIPFSTFFQEPTVAGLAAHIREEQARGRVLGRPQLRRRNRDNPIPLSFAQEQLWRIDQLQPKRVVSNIPFTVRLSGVLNNQALRLSIVEIVQRHESLRTRFPIQEGVPVQQIVQANWIEMDEIDLSDLDAKAREHQAKHRAQEEARQAFDLTSGPLMRVKLLRLEPEEHVLLLTMHRIVSDAWSIGVLVQEFVSLYEAYCQGRPSPLPELEIQSADYAIWQREWLQGEAMTEQLEYWGKQLGEAEALELPPDYPRQPLQDHHSAWISFTLPAKLTKALQELSWREGATLFMTLLAGYQLLLSQYSGQERVLVGTPIANRNLVETENLIGFFANSLALRTDLGGDPSVQELLKRVRDVTLGAYGHQEIPFEKLIEELQPDRDLRCNPVFRVMFSLQNGPVSKLELPGLRLSAAITPGDSAKFEISIFIRGLRDSLQINAEYAADLFSDATIRQMLQQHLVKVYEAMVANPAQRISEISLFSEDEQQALAAQNEI